MNVSMLNVLKLIIVFIYFSTGNAIDISVSGISSGGYAAVQYHVAFSSSLNGSGIIAGGPYWCAHANVNIALNACSKFPDRIDIDQLIDATSYAELMKSIDPTSFLKRHRVWLFSGKDDSIVNPGVVKKLEQYYLHYIPSSNIDTLYDVPAEHAFVTDRQGHECSFLGSPFINNCGISSAKLLLEHIYGTLRPCLNASNNNIISIDQVSFIPAPYTAQTAGLQKVAYAYVPNACRNPDVNHDCKLHISFHGCEQTINDIGNLFYTTTGYNECGESNNIIILYPQVRATILNPYGCFDWWGYTGLDYATKLAPQMLTIHNMANYIMKTYMK